LSQIHFQRVWLVQNGEDTSTHWPEAWVLHPQQSLQMASWPPQHSSHFPPWSVVHSLVPHTLPSTLRGGELHSKSRLQRWRLSPDLHSWFPQGSEGPQAPGLLSVSPGSVQTLHGGAVTANPSSVRKRTRAPVRPMIRPTWPTRLRNVLRGTCLAIESDTHDSHLSVRVSSASAGETETKRHPSGGEPDGAGACAPGGAGRTNL
jgi:hypothetical protein